MTEAKSNGFEPVVKHFEAFEAVDARLLAEKMAYMSRCREMREEQKRIKKMVKAEGFSVIAFAAQLKKRGLLSKIEDLEAELEDDDHESFEQMQAALGGLADTPLGQAAVKAAHPAKPARKTRADRAAESSAAVDSLTDEFDRADPAKQHVADNVVKLSGISPLN